MTSYTFHRLNGLEPDNLLAFMAILGLLRALEEARPEWHPRTYWVADETPMRPTLRVPGGLNQTTIIEAVVEGLASLSALHDFKGLSDLKLSPEEADLRLKDVTSCVETERYRADLWSALVSDAAIASDGKKVEPTPLCLMFGQGHQHFLSRLSSVPQKREPPQRGSGRKKRQVSEVECLHEALFEPWDRPDRTESFRWDPNEDVRYALRAKNPTNSTAKETTQHGANRLAAIGLSQLTVVPYMRSNKVRLAVLGGERQPSGEFSLIWPLWRDPISLATIRALLSHPHLNKPEISNALGIFQFCRTRRIRFGKFMNFTNAELSVSR